METCALQKFIFEQNVRGASNAQW